MVSETVKLLLLGIVFHAVFLWSIFDIYFVSPVVHISRHFGPPQSDAPAKRVVVISGMSIFAFFPSSSSPLFFLRDDLSNGLLFILLEIADCCMSLIGCVVGLIEQPFFSEYPPLHSIRQCPIGKEHCADSRFTQQLTGSEPINSSSCILIHHLQKARLCQTLALMK